MNSDSTRQVFGGCYLAVGQAASTKALSTLLLSLCLSSYAATLSAAGSDLQRLKRFSLEDLAALEVSIVGKAPQKAVDIPAAVYVLTAAQIRNSGATNIPDLLRGVPGLHVAQMDANKWIVSSRGFSSRITNKLLVMIDGRSIYSPLFGGVVWDQQNLMLEDVERIEVVRGPGGTAWGSNAVNGVINIITKHTRDTQGGLMSSLVGSEKNIVSLRQGGKLAPDASYRLYAKRREHEESTFLDGSDATDEWSDTQVGFRLDWQPAKNKQLTLQGDVYRGSLSERITVPSLETATFTTLREDNIDVSGANLMAKWSQTSDSGASNELKVYFDHVERDQWVIDEQRDMFDVAYQYDGLMIGQHNFTFGAGYRYTRDKLSMGDLSIGQVRIFSPEKRSDHLFSGFVQDDIELQKDRWWLTLGSKVEHNQYTGTEFQPSMRLRWKSAEGQMLWGGVSKAIRTPSRAETDGLSLLDVLSAGPPPVALLLEGNDDLKVENLTAYELGFRYQAGATLIFDMAMFYLDYDNLISFESGGIVPVSIPSPISALSNTLTLANELEGASYGVEFAVLWSPRKDLHINASYSALTLDLSPKKSSLDTLSEKQEGLSPQHQFNFSSNYHLQENLSVNATARYVGELRDSNVDAYTELDASVQWMFDDALSISLVARNLLHSAHQEALPAVYPTAATKVEREFFIKLDWSF